MKTFIPPTPGNFFQEEVRRAYCFFEIARTKMTRRYMYTGQGLTLRTEGR